MTNVAFAYGGGALNPPGNWATQINGPSIVSAPKAGNTGTGVAFADWSGSFNEIDNGVSRTFQLRADRTQRHIGSEHAPEHLLRIYSS